VNEITEDIESLRQEKSELEDEIQSIESLEKDISRSEEELDRRRTQLDELEAKLNEKEDTLSKIRSEINEAESELEEAGSETLDIHRRKKEIEVEKDSLEESIEDLDERIRDIEAEIDTRSELEEKLDKVSNSIKDARSRIDRLEEDAVESFNFHMDEILDVLDYENLERIWIEPRERERKEGRQKVEERVFDLHVVREDDEGNVYEDEVENLSESEKEVAGLVFALSGYLAHEVHEDLPFILLDSLGALDADRVGYLLDYFEDYVDYLVVAVLPEVSEKIGSEYNTVETV
jgi:DNA repair exonuclease SbcCD ATPase subunit